MNNAPELVKALTRIVLVGFLLLLTSYAFAETTVYGRVVRVSDGDTIVVLDASNAQHKIRFAEIDTPESRQPWGQKAKAAMAELVAGKNVVVRVTSKDRYGRSIGYVSVNGLETNRYMVAEGHAWVYTRYSDDPSLIVLQKEAKAAKKGLWSLPPNERIEPWVWRRQNK